jgi:DNA-binding transcriptional ArsR family regulator
MKRNAKQISALLKAGSHPLRIRIMIAMLDAPSPGYRGRGSERVIVSGGISPSKLVKVLAADDLADGGPKLGVASYHVRMLRDWGLVELLWTAPARGALEHYYKATKLGRQFANLVAALANEEESALAA